MNAGLLDILVQKGRLTQQAAEEVPARLNPGEPVHAGLVRLGMMTEEQVMPSVAQQWMLPTMELEGITVDPELVERISTDMPVKRLVKDKGLLPFARTNGLLRVAVWDPGDLASLDELARRLRVKVAPVVAVRSAIDRIIRETYGIGEAEADTEADKAAAAAAGEDADVRDAQDTAVVRLVKEVFEYAVRARASDIHIEPYEKKLRIRFRIDGVLHDAPLPEGIHKREKAIVARVKILAGLKTDEKRLPQDGRIKQIIAGRNIDFRVSVIPMLYGEGVVLRILDQSSVLYGLEELGMTRRNLDLFQKVIDLPHGICLVTGPTGSGKTTTLYAALNKINSEDLKIITIEDPVEYQLHGINQIEVKAKIGLTFAEGLRRVLRHDPDVILVGEIRDSETALVATQASLTGHLVFSTLHTNDAPSAMTRLVDMGLEPYLASSTVEAVLAQRLVRILCKHCKEEYDPAGEVLPPELAALKPASLHRPKGCTQCGNTGFRGRKGIFELMPLDDVLREMIIRKDGAHTLRRHAMSKGMRSLRQDGWEKVMAGVTTVDEIVRTTKEEEIGYSK